MMLHNPYDLIIIKENVIPQDHLEQIMLLTNNTKDIAQAQAEGLQILTKDEHFPAYGVRLIDALK